MRLLLEARIGLQQRARKVDGILLSESKSHLKHPAPAIVRCGGSVFALRGRIRDFEVAERQGF